MGNPPIKDPNPRNRWLIYLGVSLLAAGVVVLVIAAFLQYAAAIR